MAADAKAILRALVAHDGHVEAGRLWEVLGPLGFDPDGADPRPFIRAMREWDWIDWLDVGDGDRWLIVTEKGATVAANDAKPKAVPRAVAPSTPCGVLAFQRAVWTSELKPTTRFVALAVASFATTDTGADCWPKQTTVAERTGLGRQSVNKHLGLLEADGWLRVTKRRAGGGKVYQLAVPDQMSSSATADVA